jgi:ABC-type multidrug transport system permease subunit
MALLVMLLAYALAVPVYGVVIPSSWPSGLVVLLVSTISFSALGMAIVSVVHGEQSVLAVSLGSLITLSFFSDIFIIGADFPDWLDAISWFFPLRHAVNAFVDAMAVDASGVVLGWDHLAVVAAWGVAAVLVVLARFSSDATTTRSPEPERVAVG